MTKAAGDRLDRLVGDRLRQMRESKGIEAGRMAQVLGVDLAQYRRWEAGRERMPAHQALEAAQTLGCSISDFYPQ